MTHDEKPVWTRRLDNGAGSGFDGIVRRAGDMELAEILGPDRSDIGSNDWTGVDTADIASPAPPLEPPQGTTDWSDMAIETQVEPPLRPRIDIARPRASELADTDIKPGAFLRGLMFWRATR